MKMPRTQQKMLKAALLDHTILSTSVHERLDVNPCFRPRTNMGTPSGVGLQRSYVISKARYLNFPRSDVLR